MNETKIDLAEALRVQARKDHYKGRVELLESQLELSNRWLKRSAAANALQLLAFMFLVAGFVCTLLTRPTHGQTPAPIPTSDPVSSDQLALQELTATTPPCVLASVWMNGCSATVVSKGPSVALVIGAGHCVKGHRPGQTYRAWNVVGRETILTLLASEYHDGVDVAAFEMPADDVIAVTPVPEDLPPSSGTWEAVGFPQGQGPNYKRISAPTASGAQWLSRVETGRYYYGDSGGGVFGNGLLCGVIHGGNGEKATEAGNTFTNVFATPHQDVIRFTRQQCRRDRHGNAICPPPQGNYAPPAWKPNPNVIVAVPPVKGNAGEVAPAPPVDGKPALPPQSQPDLLAELVKLRSGLDAIREQLKSAPGPDASIGEKLAALNAGLQKLASRPDGPAFDPDALKSGLQQSLRVEVGKIATEQEETFRSELRAQLKEHGVAGLPDAVSSAASAAARGAVSQAKGDIVNAVSTTVTNAAPSFLQMLGVGGLAGLAGGGPIGLAGFFALRGIKKLIQRKGASTQSRSTEATSSHTHTTQTREVPVPIAVASPPPPQVVMTETLYTPVERDTHSQAYAWAKEKMARMNPTLAEAAHGQMDSLIAQWLSGRGVK